MSPPEGVEPIWRIGVAAEDTMGAENARLLGASVVADVCRVDVALDWVDPSEHVVWTGLDQRESFVPLTSARRLIWGRGRHAHGRFKGESGGPDALQTRRIFLSFVAMDPQPHIVVIARDIDRQADRRRGFEQARHERELPFRAVLAGMDPEAEAWRVVAFIARDDDERTRLDEECKLLGFDPQQQPERLDSTSAQNRHRSPKQCLDRLTGGDRQRGAEALSAPLAHLAATSLSTGLPVYIADFRREIEAIFGEFLQSR